MLQQIKYLAVAAAALAGASLLGTTVAALTLDELSWQTAVLDDNFGAVVVFEATFVNNNEVPSDPVSGELHPQPFGAFVTPLEDLICAFEVPSLPAGGEYTVNCEIPLANLPPTAELLLPWEGEPGDCLRDNFWSGGVEASWIGDGDGLESVHRGTLLVCPVLGCSYIRVSVDCPEGAEWAFKSAFCSSAFGSDFVDLGLESAPNPLPPGPFEGWICADGEPHLPPGSPCAFDLMLTCGERSAEIHVAAVTCDCQEATAVEPSTWGRIKQHLRR